MGTPSLNTTANSSSSTGRFPKEHELDNSLVIHKKQICRRPKAGQRQPNYHDHPPTLPSFPTRFLDNSPESLDKLATLLQNDLITPRLNLMAPHLWLVATKNHASISPFTEQGVRGRMVVLTENPELHLVWIDDRVFVKPIPVYLMSHAFWEKYLDSSFLSPLPQELTDALIPAALGFLRSWTYLIQHESDFKVAVEAGLIPRNMQYARFMRFLSNFESSLVSEAEVSPRYSNYGQLRLSRLNKWAKVFLRTQYFEPVHWQYWQVFQTYIGPLLFIFAAFSVILSAMQVGLTGTEDWPAFTAVSVWFAVVTLLAVAATAVSLVLLFLSMGLRELWFVIRH